MNSYSTNYLKTRKMFDQMPTRGFTPYTSRKRSKIPQPFTEHEAVALAISGGEFLRRRGSGWVDLGRRSLADLLYSASLLPNLILQVLLLHSYMSVARSNRKHFSPEKM
ncbi:hypothetical protein M5K25_023637 [Dendrobium thyrsiflorum]|uniref:Uncharacterized protein n=1 Tax=Dendrobium thyrsiflorum TaxID=117978 RepID=A0ABD0U8N0_DENTH